MATHRGLKRLMADANRLDSSTPPKIGRIERDPTWGRVGPAADSYMNRGSSIAGEAFASVMRSAPIDDPASRMVPTSQENFWITVSRKIARNEKFYSQQSKLNSFIVFTHPAVDQSNFDADVADSAQEGRSMRFLASIATGDTRVVEGEKQVNDRTIIGGYTAFLDFEISLSEMNFQLQEQEPALEDDQEDRTFSEVTNLWKWGGVVEVTQQNTDKYGSNLGTYEDTESTSVVRGMSFVANYWGANITRGTRLFLIAKRYSRDNSKYIPTKIGSHPYILGVTAENLEIHGLSNKQAKENGIIKKPFQIIPYGDPDYDYPPRKALVYIDNNGYERIGHVIYVGMAYEPSSKRINADLYKRTSYDDSAVMRLPRVNIMMGV